MKIDEVSKRFGLTKDTLRYYEKIGLIVDVPKNESGQREYSEESINHIYFIMCMRRAGLTLKQIKEYMDLYDQGDETHEERLDILLAQREYLEIQMDELKETMDYMDHKIEIYKNKQC